MGGTGFERGFGKWCSATQGLGRLVSIRRAHLRPGLGFGRCAGTCMCSTQVVHDHVSDHQEQLLERAVASAQG
jgi:hypothetical protein